MSAHTLGPWVAGDRHRDGTVVTGGNPEFVICTTDCGRGSAMIEYSAMRAEDIANAARIVACVNYCEGYDRLPDTSLRELENSYASGVENLNRVIASATAERDRLAALNAELLAALERAEENLASEFGADHDFTADASAAIAKARS